MRLVDIDLQAIERARFRIESVPELRARLGASQHVLAAIIGVHPSNVVRWEGGKSTPKGNHLARMVGLTRQLNLPEPDFFVLG